MVSLAIRHDGMDHGAMDMGGMSGMSGMASATGSAAGAAATGMAMGGGGGGMSMGGMGGAAKGPSCKISMLWNWNTVDTCFISSTWHNRTTAMYAGSVVGVFFLAMAIEAVRRAGREYDRKLTARAMARVVAAGNEKGVAYVEPSWIQHILRALIYGVQFTAAFLVMLLGMYYNGGILFAIFSGHTIGYYLFAKDTLREVQTDSGCAC